MNKKHHLLCTCFD